MASSLIPSTVRTQLQRGLESFLTYRSTNGQTRKPLHVLWSSADGWPYAGCNPISSNQEHGQEQEQEHDIAVLDSSFNPPHFAHLSLASSEPILSSARHYRHGHGHHYGAHLLLLSSRNADKPSNRPGDAPVEKRLLMMYQLAKDLETRLTSQGVQQPNVAVGIVEEPLMADKSSLIHEWLQKRHASRTENARLHWVVGYDTLVRFFDVKYYPSREVFEQICRQYFEVERTTFVCARRVLEDGSGGSASDPAQEGHTKEERQRQMRAEEDAFLASELVKPYVSDRSSGDADGGGSVAIFDLPVEAQRASSTLVRKILLDKEASTKEKLERLQPLLSSRTMAEFLCEESIYA